MRVLNEAEQYSAVCINYLGAHGLLREEGKVCGAILHDAVGGNAHQVRAKVVINATGAWADKLRGELGETPKLRPLRGSHLIFPLWRLPVGQAVSFMHPWDGRPVFVYPWEGIALLGTTDLDHAHLETEASISPEEVAYLMAGVCWQFPELGLGLDDILSTYAGVRPVLSSGAVNPSKETRDHVVLQEHGLVTVTGGKLTTFRAIALDTLKRIRSQLPEWRSSLAPQPIFEASTPPALPGLSQIVRERLYARYGADAAAVASIAQEGELDALPGSDVLWVELRWAARQEAVVRLEDMMLRRTRLGILTRDGGADYMPRVRDIAMSELGWDNVRWNTEEAAYRALIAKHYSLPPREQIPAWDRAPSI
jgi:glycerol-3-phosphate dehydrogenase